MTPAQIIPRIITWTRRRRTTTERRTFTTPSGGVFVFDRRMSDADVAAFEALWRKRYSATGGAHPVVVLEDEEEPCA